MKTRTSLKNQLYKKSLIAASVFVTGLIFLSSSCKDDPPKPNPEDKDPVISSFDPTSGEPGDTISIDGQNFNDGASNTKVVFNSTSATILGGTVSTIEVTVPQMDAATVSVVAIVGGDSSNAKNFTVTEPEQPALPIELDDFTPKTGSYEDEITITGKYFTDDVDVYINGKQQTDITYVDSKTLTIRLEKQTGSGEVTLIDTEGTEDTEDDTEKTFEDELGYEFGYSLESFIDAPANDILQVDDGTIYVIWNKGLLKYNSSGELIDTLLDFSFAQRPQGFFQANDGTIYITDMVGGVLVMDQNGNKIDTLINGDPNLPPSRSYNLTGDNKGNLYVTTTSLYTIVKIDIEEKSSEVLVTTDSDYTSGIDYNADEDSLYVASIKGLFKVHVNGGKLNYIHEFPDETVWFGQSDMSFTSDGALYITGNDFGNMYFYNPGNGIEEIFTKAELDMGGVYGLGVDNQGNLLIPSNSTIKRIIRE